jgi:hypothetical protein
MLDCAGLPKHGYMVFKFSNTANANSCNDDAMTTTLHILSLKDAEHGITYCQSSTATTSGLTGVSDLPQKNPIFDPRALFED